MARPTIFFVCDDPEAANRMKMYASQNNCDVQTYGSIEWARKLTDATFVRNLQGDVPALSSGMNQTESGGKVIPFPGPGVGSTSDTQMGKKVKTINELESLAIENAIHQYNGNLTEAARALGIGRATLYRKVKQYNIDPSNARKKQAA